MQTKFGVWLSLVERMVRDHEAGGSNPLTPTINMIRILFLGFIFFAKAFDFLKKKLRFPKVFFKKLFAGLINVNVQQVKVATQQK